MNKKTTLSTNIILIIVISLWASAFVGIRVGLRGYSPGALALLRYLVASIAMIPLYMRYRTRNNSMSLSEIIRIVLIGVFGIGIYNIALNYGEINVSAATASFIINQAPVIIVVLAVIFLKERLGIFGWLGLVVSCSGIGLMAYSERGNIQLELYSVYIFIAAIVSALYAIAQKPLLRKFNGVELTALVIWSGTIIMLIFTPSLLQEIRVASWISTLTVFYLGIFPGVIAYTLWSVALARIPASQTASYLYFLPLLTTLIGWVFINEIPVKLSLAGGIIALLGSVVVQINQNNKNKKDATVSVIGEYAKHSVEQNEK